MKASFRWAFYKKCYIPWGIQRFIIACEDMIDHPVIHTTWAVEKLKLERDLNPWPLRYRYSALNWAIKPSESHLAGVIYCELTMWPAPRWLDSSVGRALHRYRRGHGFESRSGLNLFQALISQLLFHNCSFSAVQRYDLSYIHLQYWLCWPPVHNSKQQTPLIYYKQKEKVTLSFWEPAREQEKARKAYRLLEEEGWTRPEPGIYIYGYDGLIDETQTKTLGSGKMKKTGTCTSRGNDGGKERLIFQYTFLFLLF